MDHLLSIQGVVLPFSPFVLGIPELGLKISRVVHGFFPDLLSL